MHSSSQPTKAIQNRKQNSARIELSNLERPIPDNTRQVLLTSTDQNKKLTDLNPCKIEIGLIELCGEVEKLDYLKSGSIMVTTKSLKQTQLLLKTKSIPKYDIPVSAGVAWNRQLTYGRLYAREFGHDTTLDELLKYLEPHNVVGIRKLFRDPSKEHIPLFVLTFLGPRPEKIKLGSIQYDIDIYIPSPIKCRNCWRIGHLSVNCRSRETCKYCSSIEHKSESCTATVKKCINCRDQHDSCSIQCPRYIQELDICKLTAERGISFIEARNILRPKTNQNVQLPSQTEYPSLPQTHPRPNIVQRLKSLNQNIANKPTTSQYLPNTILNHSNNTTSSARNFPTIIPDTPTQHTSYSEVLLSQTQSDDEIPPGQQTNPNHASQRRKTPNNTPRLPLLDIPDPSYSIPNPYYDAHHPYAQSSFENQNLTRIPTEIQNPVKVLHSIIPQILPHIITLLFATQLTDKIVAITKIGQILELDDIVKSTLTNLNLSSRS